MQLYFGSCFVLSLRCGSMSSLSSFAQSPIIDIYDSRFKLSSKTQVVIDLHTQISEIWTRFILTQKLTQRQRCAKEFCIFLGRGGFTRVEESRGVYVNRRKLSVQERSLDTMGVRAFVISSIISSN